jgi:glycosyltransferase involved in cell wall biosynthesis
MQAKKKIPTVSCIVPFYNEGRRVLRVLGELLLAKNISEIIAVDDGSSDKTSIAIKQNFPGIKLIRLPKNKGKSATVQEGVKAAKGKLIFLFDADLKNFKAWEIDRAVDIFNRLKTDMLVLRQVKDSLYKEWFSKISIVDIIISGQRLLFKKDLLKIFKRSVKKYRLEVAINSYLRKNRKKAYWLDYSGTNTTKIEKNGLFDGLNKSLAMTADIVGYIGLVNFIKQTEMFAKSKVIASGRGKNLKIKVVKAAEKK